MEERFINDEINTRARFMLNEIVTGVKNTAANMWNGAFHNMNPRYQHYNEALDMLQRMLEKELYTGYIPCDTARKNHEDMVDRTLDSVLVAVGIKRGGNQYATIQTRLHIILDKALSRTSDMPMYNHWPGSVITSDFYNYTREVDSCNIRDFINNDSDITRYTDGINIMEHVTVITNQIGENIIKLRVNGKDVPVGILVRKFEEGKYSSEIIKDDRHDTNINNIKITF